MKTIAYIYLVIAIELQMIAYLWLTWGPIGAVLGFLISPVAAIFTSIGALLTFGSWLPIIHIVAFLILLYTDERK